jgi:hypothetical protein
VRAPNGCVNVSNVNVDGEDARRKLADAFMRLIEARRASVGDPVVTVDGKRIDDHGNFIEHHPSTADASLNEGSSSPQKGPLNARGGVATTPAETTPTGGQNKISKYSTVPGLSAGFALDGLDDNLSTTQKFLNWKGHGGPP